MKLRKRRPVRQKRIILTGGGTGGHVFPCLAIYNILKHKNMVADALYLGIRGRAEEQIVPRAGLRLAFIKSSPMAGGSLLARLAGSLTILQGMCQAAVHLLRFRPQLVIGTGGYVSAPVVFAAFLLKPLLRLKIIIEEQNLVPGLLNKAASLVSDVMLVNYRETSFFVWSHRCVYAGYPVRKEYLETGVDRAAIRRRLGIPPEDCLVLVTGGSLGARSINQVIARAADRLSRIPGLFLVHSYGLATGGSYQAGEDTRAILGQQLGTRFDEPGFTARTPEGRVFYRGVPFLHDMADYQKAAGIIISRAGAGSLAEIAALGRASIIIPKRGLPGDHQELNAIAVGQAGGCEVLFERHNAGGADDVVDEDELVNLLDALRRDPDRRLRLENRSRELFWHDSHKTIYQTIHRVMEGLPVHYTETFSEPDMVRFQRQFDYLLIHLEKEIAGGQGQPGLYQRFFNGKIEEYLRSGDYLTVNKGIKLIGALRRHDLYPYLAGHFSGFKGYLRRNALAALLKSDEWHESFAGMIQQGLQDSYFEARTQAIALYRKFFPHLAGKPGLQRQILKLMRRRRESFEVKAEAIQAAVLFLEEREFLKNTRRFLCDRNVRLRQALLRALEWGLTHRKFTSSNGVTTHLKRMLVTTSEFQPEFRIRQDYAKVIQQFEALKVEDPKW